MKEKRPYLKFCRMFSAEISSISFSMIVRSSEWDGGVVEGGEGVGESIPKCPMMIPIAIPKQDSTPATIATLEADHAITVRFLQQLDSQGYEQGFDSRLMWSKKIFCFKSGASPTSQGRRGTGGDKDAKSLKSIFCKGAKLWPVPSLGVALVL